MSPRAALREVAALTLLPWAGEGEGEVLRWSRSSRGTAGWTFPPLLDMILDRLAGSGWPEVAWMWSRLTPSGFPVELTTGPEGKLSWVAEVAPPEYPDARRLDEALRLLREAGQPCPDDLADALTAAQTQDTSAQTEDAAAQAGPALGYGAWIGGKHDGRLKVYAELPGRLPYTLPETITRAWRRVPTGARPIMAGVEPATGKVEIYARLPVVDPLDLLPVLHETGHTAAFTALDKLLPDGVDRLRGRRLGLSIASRGDSLQLALFASARTLFPAEPEPGPGIRRTLVTLGLDPEGLSLPVAVGLAPAHVRP